MKRLVSALGTLGVLVCAVSVVSAQGRGRGPLPAPTNLQVLPKDTPAADLLATMQGFNQALGVQCTHCHVEAPPPATGARGATPAAEGGRGGRSGRGAPAPLNFASDDKPAKKAARVMLKMVTDINAKLASDLAPVLGKSTESLTKVQCATCHRGVAQPEQISNILSNLMLTKGETVAAAKYKELRTAYYGSQAYDFSEPMLNRLSQRSVAANKLDDALAWVKLNLEFYPRSANAYLQMADVYTRKMDHAQAVKATEKAVELEPDHAEAKRQLEQLKGPDKTPENRPATPAK